MSMIQGTYGVLLELSLNANIDGATGATIVIITPSDKRIEASATISNVATGIITYTTQDGDFMHAGDYQIQGIVDFGASKRLKTKITKLTVGKSL